MDLPLKGVKVLVTRPAEQANTLSEALLAEGAAVVSLPVIEIEAIDPAIWTSMDLSEQTMLVFVSRNAVQYFVAGFKGKLPEEIQCVAVGAATARCMLALDLRVDIQAPPPAGSESLLALPAMQFMAGKQVMIVRGETGRELLADTLVARGATISYIEVYRRCVPSYDEARIAEAMTVDWLVVTSVAGLENLCQIVNNEAIKLKILLVVSTRIEQVAIGLGFQHVVVTEDVSDTAVVERIVEIGQKNGK